MTALCLNATSQFAIDVENDVASNAAASKDFARAFAHSSAAGLLRLAAHAADAPLDASLSFARDLGALFLTRLCQLNDEERASAALPAPRDALEALVERAPPMRGGERLSVEVLVDAWESMRAHVAADARFVEKLGPPWHVVGKVCFHLAENKGSDDAPFAFLATYASGIGASGRAQHAPLGRALGQSAADRKRLSTLLEPVQRAADKSAFVRALIESGELFHPLAWTPDDAHALLREVPLLESAGVVVRVPDWWRVRARPRVAVTLGSKKVAGFGAEAMLDFDMQIAVGDETLRPNELKALLAGDAGLRLVKGRWVEVNPRKLREALDHWSRAAAMAKRDGISFLDGMRMLARAPGSVATRLDGDGDDDISVGAGAWLAGVLDKLRSPRGSGAVDPGPALRGTLRHYQRDGVAWLHHAATLGLGVCLADDMGLGKTIQVLALMLLLKGDGRTGNKDPPRAHLLVVPASLLANWRAEAARFAPSLSLLVAHPSEHSAAEIDAIDTRAVDVVLTTYGTVLRTPSFAEKRFDLVVLDEAQAIKNPGAKQTRAIKALQGTSRIALTGTPVENRLGDLWSLFDFLSPGLLGSAKEFGDAAKQMANNKTGGFAPLRALIKPYILRRMKTDKRVIDDLPEKTEMRAYCSLTKRQVALYADAVRELERDLQAKDSDGMKRRGVVLAAIIRMKQICNHPSQLLGDGAFAAADSGKLDRLRELCEPILARQEKLLCFTQFKEMTAPLHTFLASVFGRRGLVLHGEVAVKKRASLVEEFQRDDGPPFFVLSLKAGGTGLNLTAASHVVHFDRWWNPAVENQATDRAFRIGQKRNVMVHKLVCQGTLEEKIDGLLADKRALADDLLAETGERWLTEMSNAELLKIVSLDLSKAIADA